MALKCSNTGPTLGQYQQYQAWTSCGPAVNLAIDHYQKCHHCNLYFEPMYALLTMGHGWYNDCDGVDRCRHWPNIPLLPGLLWNGFAVESTVDLQYILLFTYNKLYTYSRIYSIPTKMTTNFLQCSAS